MTAAATLTTAQMIMDQVNAELRDWAASLNPTTTSEGDALRARAAASDARAVDSFERCDTDGFRSQWASGVMAALYRLQADIADKGGMWEFPALFDLNGNLVAAKEIETRYGWSWALLDESNLGGRFLGFFNESEARSETTRRRNNARKGYYVGRVRAAAYAVNAGGNALCVTAVVRRCDRGWSRDVEIIDNGQ